MSRMSLSAVLMAALAVTPADAGALRVSNMRATYGVPGPDRPDKKVLPGDTLNIAYDIAGMQPGADGKLHYRIAMKVSDQNGTVHLKQAPQASVAAVPQSGMLTGVATLHAGLDQPPGQYKVQVIVTDEST